MKHGVLKGFHPMIGIDMHQMLVPPAPLTPPAPYNTVQILYGLGGLVATHSKTIFTDSFGPTIMKGSDIGPLIPHIGGPSVLLAVEIPLSASKCHFGSSKYKCKEGTVGVSMLFAINLNLNCGTPVPTPTGTVIAVATHRVDMTMGDILAGIGNMAGDLLMQSALQWAGGKVGGAAAKGLGSLYGHIGAALIEHGAPAFILGPMFRLGMTRGIAGRLLGRFGDTVAGTVIGFFTGGPMGADAGTFGASTPGGTGSTLYGGWFDSHGEAYDRQHGNATAEDQAIHDFNQGDTPVDYDSGPGHLLGF